MRCCPVLGLIFATAFFAAPLHAQFKAGGASDVVALGEAQISKYQTGAIVTAQGGPVNRLQIMIPIPYDWPEQAVKIVEEDLSPGVESKGMQEFDGVKRLILSVPRLQKGETAKGVVTFEVSRRMVLPPADTAALKIPKKLNPKTAKFLLPSPYIESRDREIIDLAKEAVADKESAWDKVAAMYDLTREKIEYKTSKLKGALDTLHDGHGDCEGMTSLFIAMCRANKVPARTIRVPGHCYAEFYLENAAGQGIWMPCNLAGEQPFPELPDFRPILQKGDNFKVPENRSPQRYVQSAVSGTKAPGDGDPQVKWIGEEVEE